MHQNNVFTVAKRNLEGQDMIYQAIKFTNNVWALTELKIQPGNPNITVIDHQTKFYVFGDHSDVFLAFMYRQPLSFVQM